MRTLAILFILISSCIQSQTLDLCKNYSEEKLRLHFDSTKNFQSRKKTIDHQFIEDQLMAKNYFRKIKSIEKIDTSVVFFNKTFFNSKQIDSARITFFGRTVPVSVFRNKSQYRRIKGGIYEFRQSEYQFKKGSSLLMIAKDNEDKLLKAMIEEIKAYQKDYVRDTTQNGPDKYELHKSGEYWGVKKYCDDFVISWTSGYNPQMKHMGYELNSIAYFRGRIYSFWEGNIENLGWSEASVFSLKFKLSSGNFIGPTISGISELLKKIKELEE